MDLNAIAIRKAVTADLERLNEIVQSSSAYADEYRAILDGYEVTSQQLEQDCFFVAVGAARIVGFYSLLLEPEPELDLMFIADEAQGEGVGAALFEHMTATARRRGAQQVKIVCHPPALGFYERMGAKRVGIKTPHGRVDWDRPILIMGV